MQRTSNLIFVYDKRSGALGYVRDLVQRLTLSRVRRCPLYGLTHRSFRMRSEWRAFIRGLPIPVELLYKDQLAKKYRLQTVRLPSVFRREFDIIIDWVSEEDIRACHSLADLKKLITGKLKALDR